MFGDNKVDFMVQKLFDRSVKVNHIGFFRGCY